MALNLKYLLPMIIVEIVTLGVLANRDILSALQAGIIGILGVAATFVFFGYAARKRIGPDFDERFPTAKKIAKPMMTQKVTGLARNIAVSTSNSTYFGLFGFGLIMFVGAAATLYVRGIDLPTNLWILRQPPTFYLVLGIVEIAMGLIAVGLGVAKHYLGKRFRDQFGLELTVENILKVEGRGIQR